MAKLVAIRRHGAQARGERSHGAQAGVLRGCRECPRVAECHGPEAPRLASISGPHPAVDVEERDAIDGSAAELVRGAVLKIFEVVGDLENPHVVGT
jgi:hypothetical protein